jgi:hypothetical protein
MRFRLCCACGREVLATRGDAGASLACKCGRTVEVPSLNELQQRPVVEEPAKTEPPLTLVRMAVVFWGGVVSLLGLGLLIGNVTDVFPTFPYAGFLVMAIGGIIAGLGSRR